MPIDRDATLKKAEKLLRQGKLDAAIAEYQLIVEDQPRDWNSANTLGDLLVRAGQVDRAVAQFTRIADHLANEGFFTKASAIYKKIVKIKPDDENALLQSAELSARQGLLADAKVAFTQVAERRKTRGDKRGAAEVRVRLGRLDAGDIDARVAGARAAAELGELEGAATTLRELGLELQERGAHARAIEALREAVGLNPADEDARKLLIGAHLARGEFDQVRELATTAGEFRSIAHELDGLGQTQQAIAALAEAVRLEPADDETRSLLITRLVTGGDIARARQAAATTRQLRAIAAAQRQSGDDRGALETLADAATRDAGDVGLRTELAKGYLAVGDLAAAQRYLTREAAGDDPDLLLMLAELDLRGGRFDSGIDVLKMLLPDDPGRREQITQLAWMMVDIDTEVAYRCVDLVANAAVAENDWAAGAAALHEFVTRVPNHIPALMKLVEICVDGGLEATMYAAQAQLADAYLAGGCGAEARVIAEDLVAREPWERANIERFRRALVMLGEQDPDSVIAERLSGQTPFTSTDFLGELTGDLDLEAESQIASATESPGAPAPVPRQEPEAPRREPETPRGGKRAARQPPAVDEDAVFELGPMAIDLDTILRDEPAAPEPAAPKPPAARRADAVEIDLSGALDDLRPAGAQVPSATAPPGGSMSDDAPKPPGDLDSVFQDFRNEVSRQASADAAEQQYKLAMTYREMGLVDQAIKALEIAARSPRQRFEAAGELARIYLERGRNPQAIEWFERAAEAPAPTADAGRALLYELGATLEQAGESARALAVFLELQAEAGEFRDVAARIDRLSKVQARR